MSICDVRIKAMQESNGVLPQLESFKEDELTFRCNRILSN